MSKKTVKIETRYGSMTFKTWPEAYEFREIIATWSGFTEATQPKTVEHAVAYHLAYVEGGFAEVRALMRETEMIQQQRRIIEKMTGGLPPELIGQPPHVIQAEWDRRMRMGWLGW